MLGDSARALWHRSHNLGELCEKHAGQSVTIMGWVHRRRDHGQVIFWDLRDRYGITQVVLDPALHPECHRLAVDVRQESVVAIRGKVVARPAGMVNKKLSTGAIEVHAAELNIFSQSEVLPFALDENTETSETLRLKYRYLDLRRPEVKTHLLKRIKFVREMRRALEERNFLDIETPFLYKSTPEGAREFLVPSRIHAGQFYALPQSPQLFKQVLMVAGFDRYYQVVKCFRDEDLRADRQPEFTQVDCEMSFVDESIVTGTMEAVVRQAVENFHDGALKLPDPFPRMSFATAMEDYGCDKPDIRYDLKLRNVTDLVSSSGFKVFMEAASLGGIINAIVVPGQAEKFSRKDLDELTELSKTLGGKGLAWAKKTSATESSGWQSPIAKHLGDAVIAKLDQHLKVQVGDLLLFGAGPYEPTKAMLSGVRKHLGEKLKLYDPTKLAFLWVVDFPLLEQNPENGQWLARHHPFTSPRPEDMKLLSSDPGKVLACAYDLVLNGYEVAGGSIRIHDSEVQQQLFKVIGLSDEEAHAKFGFLLEALKFGAPPHGGIAFGVDRMAMVLSGCDAIRDVIAFPKTQKGTCLMTGAPSEVSTNQLRDLHIKVQTLLHDR